MELDARLRKLSTVLFCFVYYVQGRHLQLYKAIPWGYRAGQIHVKGALTNSAVHSPRTRMWQSCLHYTNTHLDIWEVGKM